MRPILAALVFALAALPAAAQRTIRVPSPEAMTIQAGVDLAVNGDTIIVSPGTHTGEGNREIQLRGKAITITSDKRLGLRPVIDLERQGRAFYVIRGEGPDTIIDGLIIRNGLREWKGGAIHIPDSSPTLSDCLFLDCETPVGGAIYAENSAARIAGCEFEGCGSLGGDARGGAIAIAGGAVGIADCEFRSDVAMFGGAIDVQAGEVTLDRCTFQDCASTLAGGVGGAIRLTGVSATLTDCVFERCTSRAGGGAVFLDDSTGTLVACDFVECGVDDSTDGSGIFVLGGELTAEDCTLTNNLGGTSVYAEDAVVEFNRLVATSDGGAAKRAELWLQRCESVVRQSRFHHVAATGLWLKQSGMSLIEECEFTDVQVGLASHGPGSVGKRLEVHVSACAFEDSQLGIDARHDGVVRAESCTFIRCAKACSFSSEYRSDPYLDMRDCRFTDIPGDTWGLAVHANNFVRCQFERVSWTVGLMFDSCEFRHVSQFLGSNYTNCLFADNEPGGIALFELAGQGARFRNCTFVRNSAGGAAVIARLTKGTVCQGIYCYTTGGLAEFIGCMFYGNDRGQPLFALDGEPPWGEAPPQLTLDRCVLDTEYIYVSAAPGARIDLTNLIHGVPRFVDPAAGDYRLAPGSIGIDAGDNAVLDPDITVDLDGLPRFHDDPGTPDTGAPDPARPGLPIVDIGAYEFQGESPCRADLDGDGALTFFDFVEFQNLFAAGDLRADFDFDGELTFFDFLAFQNAFAAGCP